MTTNYDNTLKKIYTHSFPSNHLLNIQLLRSIPNNEKVNSSLKVQHFFILAITPGEKNNTGYRTYNFEKSINVKYSINEMMDLSFSLKNNALGNTTIYTKFSKSSSGTKRVSIWESTKKTNRENQSIKIINLGFSSNENIIFNFAVEEALTCAMICEMLFKKAFELEFERQINNNNNNNNNNKPQIIFDNDSTESANTEVTSTFSSLVNGMNWN